jgi:protein SCO1/2
MKMILLFIISFAYGFPNGESIGNLPLKLMDEENRTFIFKNISAKKVVLAFAYTSCTYACPLIVNKMKAIQTKYLEQGINAEYILISFDPEKDTSDVLKKYKLKSNLDLPNWHFLTGSDAEIKKAIMIFGLKVKRDNKTGMIEHDNKIFLFSVDGTLKTTLDGLEASLEEL